MVKRLLMNLAFPLAVLVAVWLMWPSARTPMPEVTFNLVDGRTLSSSELRGKSILLTFWSVSCEVCLRDMPRLTSLHETMQDQNFMVLGVALPQDPPPAVIGIVEKLQPGYPIALDVHGEIAKAFGGITVTPTSYLIAPDGSINYSEHGPLDEIRVRATVTTFRG